jgi:uncharacterized protein
MSSMRVHLHWGVKIPMRDGIRLSANLYLPAAAGKASPCIFSLTPYTAARSHVRARYLAEREYPFLMVDARGRGNSEGTFRPFIQEAKDGYDIVEWIAQQPFCDGTVAMFSGSYEGYVQWATAKESPPHLVAIAPAAAAAPGIDMTMRNNISFPYLMQWLTCVAGRSLQESIFSDQALWRDNFQDWYTSGRSFRELDAIAGLPSPVFQEWLDHPMQDDYWDAFLPTTDEFARMELPVLTVTGSYDANQLGALHYYREHLRNASPETAARHHLVIGPWDHTGILLPKSEFAGLKVGSAALFDVMKLQADWYDWTLRGGPKPSFLKDKVAYYVTGAEKWRYVPSLDAVTARSHTFYLDSSADRLRRTTRGVLSGQPGTGNADTYIYDPRDLSIANAEAQEVYPPSALPILLRPIFPVHRLVEQAAADVVAGRALCYDSAPFASDVEVTGFFQFTVWLSIDQPDTDFQVLIQELTAEGGSVFLTSDLLRARYRTSLRQEELIRTTEPLRYEFSRFTFVSRLLRKGSRLRLVIGPIDSVFNQKNYNSGKAVADESMADARPVTVKLFHDEAHPSALYIPVGRSDIDDDVDEVPISL